MGKFIVIKSEAGYRFNLVASNNEIIATSEVYSSGKDACLGGIESVKKSAPAAAVEDQTTEGFETQKNPKFELYKDKKGEFRFRLKAVNGEIIASSEGYTSKGNCKNGIDSVVKNAPDAVIEFAD